MRDYSKEAKLEEHIDIAVVMGALLLVFGLCAYAIGEHEKSVVRPCLDAAANHRD